SRRDLVEREFRQDGHAVECLLPMHGYVVPERLEGFAWECIIEALGLLQASDIGLPLGQPGQRIVDALLDGIDVPGCDFHGSRRAWGLRMLHLRAAAKAERPPRLANRFALTKH